MDKNINETVQREKLSYVLRLIAHYGWDSLTDGHTSLKINNDEILTNSYGRLYSQSTPESLVKIKLHKSVSDCSDVDVATAMTHKTLHEEVHTAGCIIHTHSKNLVALSMIEEKFDVFDQMSTQFMDNVAYHPYTGAFLAKEHVLPLAEALKESDIIILQNHGVVVSGKTIEETFIKYIYLENYVDSLLKALAATKKSLVKPVKEIQKLTKDQLHKLFNKNVKTCDKLHTRYQVQFEALISAFKSELKTNKSLV